MFLIQFVEGVEASDILSLPSLAGDIHTKAISFYLSNGIDSAKSHLGKLIIVRLDIIIYFLATTLNQQMGRISKIFTEIRAFIIENEPIDLSGSQNILINLAYIYAIIWTEELTEDIFNEVVDKTITIGNITLTTNGTILDNENDFALILNGFDTKNYTYSKQDSLVIQGEILKSAFKFWRKEGGTQVPALASTWPFMTIIVVFGAEAGYDNGGPIDAIIYSVGYAIEMVKEAIAGNINPRFQIGN